MAANLLWGAGFGVAAYAASRHPAGLVVLAALIIPSIGLMSMATVLVREQRLFFSDFSDGIRHRFWAHVGLGVAQCLLVAVAAGDVLIGLQLPGLLGVVLVVGAGYLLLGVWLFAVIGWPLVLDPLRRDESLRASMRLAAVLMLAHPLRLGMLALLLLVVLVVSTVLIAALVTVSVALSALVAAHYVLPAADRLEGRATREVEVEP